MLRCIRIWSGDDGNSLFEEGHLDLPGGRPTDLIGPNYGVETVSFRETQPGSELAWHDAPTHQLVLTLTGTLEFTTREKQHFIIRPGDVLLAEDTTGTGHSWRLIGEEPWRRAYVNLLIEIKTGTAAHCIYEAVGQLQLYPRLIGIRGAPEPALLIPDQRPLKPAMVAALAAADIAVYTYSIDDSGKRPRITFAGALVERCRQRVRRGSPATALAA